MYLISLNRTLKFGTTKSVWDGRSDGGGRNLPGSISGRWPAGAVRGGLNSGPRRRPRGSLAGSPSPPGGCTVSYASYSISSTPPGGGAWSRSRAAGDQPARPERYAPGSAPRGWCAAGRFHSGRHIPRRTPMGGSTPGEGYRSLRRHRWNRSAPHRDSVPASAP